MITIIYSPHFARQYKKLPLVIKRIAEKKELLFRKDPFDKRLRTHKLIGSLAGLWACSINYQYRIIFEFIDDHTAHFHAVGDHSIYE